MEGPAYFAQIPANVRYDKSLKPNAKLLYGEITALTNREGFCWATNEYFAALYEVENETISRWISQLRNAGYIDVELLPAEGNKRRITIDKKINTSIQKSQEVMIKKSIGHDKKVNPIKENITINNTNNREGALGFLKREIPTRIDAEMMKYQTGIGPQDFDRFCADFDATVNIELSTNKIAWEVNALLSRFGKFARSWVSNNQAKTFNANAGQSTNVAAPSHGRLELRRRGA